jgi:hypothetical protein
VSQRFTDGYLRIEPDEFGSHNAAGGMLFVLQQVFELGFDLVADLCQDAAAVVLSHMLDDIGSLVGRKPFDDLSRAFRREVFQYRAASGHRRLIEELDRAPERQHHYYRRGFDQLELVEQLDEVGRCEISDLRTDSDEAFVESKIDAFPQLFQGRHALISLPDGMKT